jgi:hypothetical protein
MTSVLMGGSHLNKAIFVSSNLEGGPVKSFQILQITLNFQFASNFLNWAVDNKLYRIEIRVDLSQPKQV